jgi:hypothetical protein
MAATLVGMTWYAIGTGDAILYRERMQDASDASSYAAAVYHARGMNIIALFNILMAAIMAILIVARILIVFGTILRALFWVPYVGGLLAAAGNVIYQLGDTAANIMQKVADKVIPMLNKAQKVVKIAMPIAAEIKSVTQAKAYKAPISFGLAITPTIIQGLPVEEDEKSRICDKASEYVAALVMKPFASLPGAKYVEGMISKLIKSFGAFFCGDSKSIDLGDIGGSLAKEQCGEKKKANENKKKCSEQTDACQSSYQADMAVAKDPPAKQAAANELASCKKKDACSKEDDRPGFQPTLPDGTKGAEQPYDKNFNQKKCEQDSAKELNQQASQAAAGGKSVDGKPHRVKRGTENGYSSMQIYSVVFGDIKYTEVAKGGIKVANWGKETQSSGFSVGKMLGPTLGRVNFARAEYYYDCKGLWADKDCNKEENAMWNMNWRVRLRRVSSKSLIGPDIGAGVDMISRVEGFLQGEGLSSPAGLLDGFSQGMCQKLPAACAGGNGGIMGIVTGQFDGIVGGLFDSALSSYSNFGRDPNNPNSLSSAEQAVSGLNALENNAIQLNGALMGGAIGIMH